jgi:hypothetical protein
MRAATRLRRPPRAANSPLIAFSEPGSWLYCLTAGRAEH